jgi:hypothetical protein
MVVRPKHVVDNINKIVNNYWNRVVLDGNPWIWFAFIYASAITSENQLLRTAMTSSLSTSTTNPIVITWSNTTKHEFKNADSTKKKTCRWNGNKVHYTFNKKQFYWPTKKTGFFRQHQTPTSCRIRLLNLYVEKGIMAPSCMRFIMNVSWRLRGSSGPEKGLNIQGIS